MCYLKESMKMFDNPEDMTNTLKPALAVSGCDKANIVHKPRLLSGKGSPYISRDLDEWLEDQKIDHVRGAPYHS